MKKVIYLDLLKKLTPIDIEEMRRFKRNGWSSKLIGIKFNVSTTTAEWHTGDIPYERTYEIKDNLK